MKPEIPITYEELKTWLDEYCNIKIEDHPKQLLDLFGYPYWRCTNWEELSEAMSHCTAPKIGDAMFSSPKGLEMVEVYDDWIHNNIKYRWDLYDDSSISSANKEECKDED